MLKEKAPQVIFTKYKVEDINMGEIEILEEITKNRGYLNKGAVPDLDKTCHLLIQDYRRGNLGKISLD